VKEGFVMKVGHKCDVRPSISQLEPQLMSQSVSQSISQSVPQLAPQLAPQLGSQRDWFWRGWRIRYTYLRSQNPHTSQPPLLFLHGFGSALDQWYENLLPLSQDRPVYALDFIGFGGSEKAAAPYGTDLWVAQVYEFWRSFIGQPVVLVGHSLGSLVSLTAAVQHPEMVTHLVMLTLPAARQELLPKWLQPIISEIENLFATPLLIHPLFYFIRRPKIIRSVLRAIYVNSEKVTDQVVQSFVRPTGDRGAAQTLVRLTKARTQNEFSLSTKELLPRVSVPILLLWGKADRVIPLPWDEQFPALNPRLKLVEIADAGHCCYDEAAAQVNAEILTWLK
jgi:pimeloyl-ACP methyl ester carboxylesterase